MSSIREIQIQRVLTDTVRALYSTGVRPSLNDIFLEVSQYFGQFPAGAALPTTEQFFDYTGRSNVSGFNELMARTMLNLYTIYEATQSQVSDILEMTSAVRVRLENLEAKRKRLTTQVDDYLLSLYNSDGYYYSFGDTFPDTNWVDLGLTDAFIDTAIGSVTLPTVSSLTRATPGYLIALSSIKASVTPLDSIGVTNATVNNVPYRTISEISGAFDGLTNTVWAIEVETNTPAEVIVEVILTLGDTNNVVDVSRVDFNPHTITPIQVFTELGIQQNNSIQYVGFGNSIQTSLNKISFIDSLVRAKSIKLTLRKTKNDYIDTSSNSVKYRYVFGAKEISIIENVYDNTAVFVSEPIYVPFQIAGNNPIIDAVSLVTEEDIPADTQLHYSIAGVTIGSEEELDLTDHNWQPIVPMGKTTNQKNLVVRFNGAQSFQRTITSSPTGSEIQRIALDSTNIDLSKRNPSAVIIEGTDIYRIAAFKEDYLENSLKLEEGVDTSRIHSTTWTLNSPILTIDEWFTKITSTTPPDVAYGTIDNGNDFFYGGDVGAPGRNVFVETYVHVSDGQETVLKEFRKTDPNSVNWPVKVYLNGREIASVAAGIDTVLIPWTFNPGRNHVALSIVIPYATSDSPHPYVGTISLMGDSYLADFGRVKLADWNYISFFDMKYNQAREPYTFTLKNDEIISRRKPTTDFVLSYFRSTFMGPQAVKLRADLERSIDNPNVTPKINSYRLRFSYYNG